MEFGGKIVELRTLAKRLEKAHSEFIAIGAIEQLRLMADLLSELSCGKRCINCYDEFGAADLHNWLGDSQVGPFCETCFKYIQSDED